MGNPQAAPAPKQGYLRPREREELTVDIQAANEQLNEEHPHFRVQDRNAVEARKRRLESQLAGGIAPETTPLERDALAKEQRELTPYLQDKMLSRDQMMKNPPGSVGRNIKYHRDTKDAQLRWKANQLRLNPDSTDPDIANLETIRPETNRNVNYANSQIGQDQEAIHSVPSRRFMENYDGVDWGNVSETLERQSELLEKAAGVIESQEQRLRALEGPDGPDRTVKPKREQTGAQKDGLIKARKAATAKREEEAAAKAEAS